MLQEAIVVAEVENINKKNRVKALVGIDGTQLNLDRIIEKLRAIDGGKIPVSGSAERHEYMERMRGIRSEIISSGMMIEEYLSVLSQLWDDFDKAPTYKMN